MKFVRKDTPVDLASLDAYQREQLRCAGERFDGEKCSAEERLDPHHPHSMAGEYLECWEVIEGTQTLFDIWLYGVDSGTLFKAGTSEVVADIIQFGFSLESNPEMWQALEAAHWAQMKDGSVRDTRLSTINFEYEEAW